MKLTDLSEQEAKELADQYLQRLKSAGVKLLNTKEMTVLNGLLLNSLSGATRDCCHITVCG